MVIIRAQPRHQLFPKSCFLIVSVWVLVLLLEVNLKTWGQDHSVREHRLVLLREEKAWQTL